MARAPDEKAVQIKVSPERATHRTALKRGETVRTFIPKVLQRHGMAVSGGDLADHRKTPGR